ncbi:hypothetical protein NDU88_011048 [Pleurodeles waltl]|uniref:Uncharacterized protein n=1 Tax=Pleurodeles waltl TaxID=8319 RepID=A0AAV7QWE7_PLEWA|nr:hypothetical protein NDU88_011048 [Pleurodeles waltl]
MGCSQLNRHLHLSDDQGEDGDEVSEERRRAKETERVKQNLVVPIREEPALEILPLFPRLPTSHRAAFTIRFYKS